MMRFTEKHVAQWREDGFCVIDDFFSAEEMAPLLADYEKLYAESRQPERAQDAVYMDPKSEDYPTARRSQFVNIHTMPYEGSVELNLISLHPALIHLARALLGIDDVHCYQSHTWAKFTGQTDYEQDFHCDFHNHTLTVPSDDHAARTVDFIFYLTDVTEQNGSMRYVTKSDVIKAIGRPALAAPLDEEQESLRQYERKVEVRAGGLVAHSIDTMHRGANLLEPGGRRFSMTVGYKAAGNDNIQYHVWQTAPDKDWAKIINHATPEQLTVLGIPRPGDKFWTLRTLKLTQARWPDFDMTAYFSGVKADSRLMEAT